MKYSLKTIKRTFEHIQRVQKNAMYLIENHNDVLKLEEHEAIQLMENVMKHDCSKFSKFQYYAYDAKFSDNYKNESDTCKKAIDKEFEHAWQHHLNVENHHHEKYGYIDSIIQIEIVCDLQAMAQEFNEGTCLKYFKTKWIPEYLETHKGFTTTKEKQSSDDFEYFSMIGYMEKIIKCFDA